MKPYVFFEVISRLHSTPHSPIGLTKTMEVTFIFSADGCFFTLIALVLSIILSFPLCAAKIMWITNTMTWTVERLTFIMSLKWITELCNTSWNEWRWDDRKESGRFPPSAAVDDVSLSVCAEAGMGGGIEREIVWQQRERWPQSISSYSHPGQVLDTFEVYSMCRNAGNWVAYAVSFSAMITSLWYPELKAVLTLCCCEYVLYYTQLITGLYIFNMHHNLTLTGLLYILEKQDDFKAENI